MRSHLQLLLGVLVLSLAPQASHGQLHRMRPPSLAAAHEREAAAASAYSAALAGSPTHQQQQQQQQRQRHLLAEPVSERGSRRAAAAAAAPPPDEPEAGGPFANLTAGNATASAGTALRKALLEGYDKMAHPSELGPVNVALNVALHKILSVDLYGGTLRAAVWLRQEWDDPRLTWNKQEWNVSKVWFANDQQGDTEIWQPDIALWNAANPILYTLSQEPLAVNSSGRVFWSRPGFFEVACNFKGLSAFPFGRVRCALELGSWSLGPWYVNVDLLHKGYDVGGSVTSGEAAIWTEYRIQHVTAIRHEYPPYPCCPDESLWPVVLIEMALERQNLIYMMKVIVPQVILTAVAFSTFWLSPACGERLGLAVTVPLAVAVYDLLTFSQLPVSNKVTLVSAMGMTAFLFSMAVLVENAFVIQLWHYTEHAYFKGASVMAATVIAYREQLVWVHLLGCFAQLKMEVTRRQLAALEAKKGGATSWDKSVHSVASAGAATINRWSNLIHQQLPSSPPRAAGAAGGSMRAAVAAATQAAQAADTSPPVSPDTTCKGISAAADSGGIAINGAAAALSEGSAPGAASRSTWSVAQRARSCVMMQLGELETQIGAAELKADAGESLLLGCTTREQLRMHLSAILASQDRALAVMQRRIRKAYLVFGEDAVVSRLHATLVGGGGSGGNAPGTTDTTGSVQADAASDAGGSGGDAAPHALNARLAEQFNRRWQLLSMMIDHTCRYLFITAYLLCMVILIVVLIMKDE